ncbi:MAG TPA: hypothetical protein VFT06_08425, partial [Flavisolibacter sp.]|nr:hypothetical protein [Flavisolibacter sp.]
MVVCFKQRFAQLMSLSVRWQRVWIFGWEIGYFGFMKIGELLAAIEIFAAPELQEDYDNAGLITGNRDMECTGVLCT